MSDVLFYAVSLFWAFGLVVVMTMLVRLRGQVRVLSELHRPSESAPRPEFRPTALPPDPTPDQS